MQPFDPSRKCPKCGHDQVRVSYCNKERWQHYGDARDVYEVAVGDDGDDCEHLHRICERCHYEWVEACLSGEDGGGERTEEAGDGR